MQPQFHLAPLRAHSTPEPDMPPPPEGDPVTPPPEQPAPHRPRTGRGADAATTARENALSGSRAASSRSPQPWRMATRHARLQGELRRVYFQSEMDCGAAAGATPFKQQNC